MELGYFDSGKSFFFLIFVRACGSNEFSCAWRSFAYGDGVVPCPCRARRRERRGGGGDEVRRVVPARCQKQALQFYHPPKSRPPQIGFLCCGSRSDRIRRRGDGVTSRRGIYLSVSVLAFESVAAFEVCDTRYRVERRVVVVPRWQVRGMCSRSNTQ